MMIVPCAVLDSSFESVLHFIEERDLQGDGAVPEGRFTSCSVGVLSLERSAESMKYFELSVSVIFPLDVLRMAC